MRPEGGYNDVVVVSPAPVAKVMVLPAAAVRRGYQGRVASVPVDDGSCDAVRLVAGLLCVRLPKGVLPKRIPQLGARDVVLVSIGGSVVLFDRDDGLSIVDHAGDRCLRVHR